MLSQSNEELEKKRKPVKFEIIISDNDIDNKMKTTTTSAMVDLGVQLMAKFVVVWIAFLQCQESNSSNRS